jgi:hypothetical protein
MKSTKLNKHLLVGVLLCHVFLQSAFRQSAYGVAELGEPRLNPNERIRLETGMVNGLLVDRYTWRDSAGRPRSASLVRYGQGAGGYAVQFTYQVQDSLFASWRTVYLNPPQFRGDAGFGYFVSHELYRYFDATVCPDGSNNCTIAALHGEDDSPLSVYLPGSGRTVSVTTDEAIHEFTLNYPHWGTTIPIANPNGGDVTPSHPAFHKKYDLPVTIRWTFTAGRDYPLWSVTYDFRAAPVNTVSADMRGPYGYLIFDGGINGPITALEWGDRYVFKTQGNTVSTQSQWTWNTLNRGARYNLLVAGQYEMGVVETVPYRMSKLGSGYSDDRGHTSAHGLGCADAGWRMPCNWEWPYQSVQYEEFDTRPTRAKKLAWGTAPYMGTDRTSDDMGEPMAGYPVVSYSVWITFNKSAGTKTRNLATSIRSE